MRNSHGFLYAPAAVQPLGDDISAATNATRPLRKRQCLAVVRQASHSARVAALRERRGPTHILWRVVAIAINAIDRMLLGWTRSDIAKKRLERTRPLFANTDASAAISVEAVVTRIIAALLHGLPDFVFGRLCQSVCSLSSSDLFATKAAARPTPPSQQIVLDDDLLCAAVTLTQPSADRSRRLADEFKGDKSTETVTGDVCSWFHPLNFTTGRFA